MAIVSTLDRLAATVSRTPITYPTYQSIALFTRHRAAYAQLYRTQPAVRKCVEFLGRNIAQLGIHVYRRLDDDDRERVRPEDHALAQVLAWPHPSKTRYELVDQTMQDLGVYWNAFWLKLRVPPIGLQLQRMPAAEVEVKGVLWPTSYTWTPQGGSQLTLAADDVVHFWGYNPENPLEGLSPLETLRQYLAEAHARGDYREKYWKRGGRPSYVIRRPREAKDYTTDQAKQFVEDFQAMAAAGGGPLLQSGMDIQELGQSARDAQYLESEKLTDERVAAAYHIPLPMVGILDHATFSNIKEQHKHLYQDSLGPWLILLRERLQLQVLSEFDDPKTSRLYIEWNIREKLSGSFEEQADALQKAVGRPWMTPNEARARVNLRRSTDDRDARIGMPVNMTASQIAEAITAYAQRTPEEGHAE